MSKKILVIIANITIAVLLLLVYWLEVSPYQLRHAIENEANYPHDVYRMSSSFTATRVTRDDAQIIAAREELNALMTADILAVESGLIVYKKDAPKIYASASMIALQLFELKQGKIKHDDFLAQEGGLYRIGDAIEDKTVSGIVDLRWRPYFMTDGAAVKVIDDLDAIPEQMKTGLVFYLRTTEQAELERVRELIHNYIGYEFSALPLYEFFARDMFALDATQLQLQKYAALFLLLCLFLTLFSILSSNWQQKRERYRTERMLGRSRNYFLRHWFRDSLQHWLWGVLASSALFIFITAAQGHLSERYLAISQYFIAIILSATLLSFIITLAASRFPLARNSADSQRTWRDNLSPSIITLALILGVTFLFANSFAQWNRSSRSLRQIGASTVLAQTISSAKDNPPRDLCEAVTVQCLPYSLSNFHLWTEALISLEDTNREFTKLFKLDATYADSLRISLAAGRFPREGQREVAIHERALPAIRKVDPDFGIGTVIQIDYEVVGIIRTPAPAEYAIFDSIYEAVFYIAPNAPQFTNEFFLAPWGREGVVLELTGRDNLAEVKQQLRAVYQNLEFIHPATYARKFSQKIQRSVIRLALIFIASLLLALIAYHNLIVTLLAQRTLEISIWRLLGMNITRLKRYLAQSILPIPLFVGIFATLLGCGLLLWQERYNVVLYAFICGITTTLLLSVLCFILIQQKVKPYAREEVSETYRKAL